VSSPCRSVAAFFARISAVRSSTSFNPARLIVGILP
jgi:hypothetical protein